MKKVQGLNSIRFICALIVVFGHFDTPLPPIFYTSQLGRLFMTSVNGPAAVIIFFVISGFVIHYPFKDAGSIDLMPYYSRRLLRIGIPAFITILIYHFLHMEMLPPRYGILWSIICEIIYYIIYPILFYIRKFLKWEYIILIFYVIGNVLLLNNLNVLKQLHNIYPALGLSTWLIGIPCWLVGCWLSENYSRFKIISIQKIWLLRITFFVLCSLITIVKFHLNFFLASDCFTLNLFSLFGCIWLGFEIMYYSVSKPSKILEWAGNWSYSLYLIHPTAPALVLIYLNIMGGGIKYYSLTVVIVSLICAYVFYLIIEFPSHKLSILISARIKILFRQNMAKEETVLLNN